MSKGRFTMGTAVGLLVVMLATTMASGQDDWRLEMLKQHGFSGETKELETLVAGYAKAEAGLEEALKGLASDDFKTRERAQASILMAGVAALSWLKELPLQEDPEVRVRLNEIADELRFSGPGSRDELLRHAVKSLLAERVNPGKTPPQQLVFAEWFNRNKDPLIKEYGRFKFVADRGMTGKVTEGRLRFEGNRPGDGDQHVMLTAEALGMEHFPNRFRVSCLMGGDGDDGAAAWHAGVSVGQVRLLYHPGMRGGSYRIETIGDKTTVQPNKQMGFDPDTDSLQRVEIEASVVRGGNVELSVVVASQDGKHVFRDKTVVAADVIGAVDRVGLWRSGRSGADALFDDFVLDLRQ